MKPIKGPSGRFETGPNFQNLRPTSTVMSKEKLQRSFKEFQRSSNEMLNSIEINYYKASNYVTVKEPVRPDNLVDAMNLLHDGEKELIVEAVNKYGGGRTVHLGVIPFLNREYVINCLELMGSNVEPPSFKSSPYVKHKLHVAELWVDITTTSDEYRRELNTITGEVREYRGFKKYIKDDNW